MKKYPFNRETYEEKLHEEHQKTFDRLNELSLGLPEEFPGESRAMEIRYSGITAIESAMLNADTKVVWIPGKLYGLLKAL